MAFGLKDDVLTFFKIIRATRCAARMACQAQVETLITGSFANLQ